jgi:hypothetical protein
MRFWSPMGLSPGDAAEMLICHSFWWFGKLVGIGNGLNRASTVDSLRRMNILGRINGLLKRFGYRLSPAPGFIPLRLLPLKSGTAFRLHDYGGGGGGGNEP